jgi:hypothetical protein
MKTKSVYIFFLITLAVTASVQGMAADQAASDVLYQARNAAGDDRHREAIDLYLRALDLDPSLRSTIAVELGHQYTWAEIPDSAVIWYGRYL